MATKSPSKAPSSKRALMTPAEAAEYLGTSERWVRESAWTRRIAFVKVGRYLRFDPDDLDRFRESQRVASSKEA